MPVNLRRWSLKKVFEGLESVCRSGGSEGVCWFLEDFGVRRSEVSLCLQVFFLVEDQRMLELQLAVLLGEFLLRTNSMKLYNSLDFSACLFELKQFESDLGSVLFDLKVKSDSSFQTFSF